MYTTLNKTPYTRAQLLYTHTHTHTHSELEYLQLKKNSNYPGTTFFSINAVIALCFLLLLLPMPCRPLGWKLVESL